ncbi:vasotab-TY2-like [Drosophila nasuta]|uniref:vasotab-TY2-like n=1 Tax=Drosophila nasuta TaxID=42062 RepID=UPI00295F122A|nr:vasotab-TY2-like [Drosophila nasuta]
MKIYFALIGLLLCSTLTLAQRRNCPSVCTLEYNPVCGEANVRGQQVRCQFSNPCAMTSSGCRNGINWRSTSCGITSPQCSSLV